MPTRLFLWYVVRVAAVGNNIAVSHCRKCSKQKRTRISGAAAGRHPRWMQQGARLHGRHICPASTKILNFPQNVSKFPMCAKIHPVMRVSRRRRVFGLHSPSIFFFSATDLPSVGRCSENTKFSSKRVEVPHVHKNLSGYKGVQTTQSIRSA